MDAELMKLRIEKAIERFKKRQGGRQRPLLRRKNNWIRGGVGIMGENTPVHSITGSASGVETPWFLMRKINVKNSNSKGETGNA